MAGEVFGAGSVVILPDLTQFDAILQAKVTASLAAIEKQFAVAGTGGAAGAGSLAAVGTEASAAGSAVAQKFTPAIKAATGEAEKLGKAASGAGTGLQGLSKQFAAVARLAPVLAAAFSVKLFGDFEKAAKESAAVFGSSSNEIIGFAKTLDTSFGLTATAALRFAADFGNALQNIGFSQKVAAAASEELTKRTADVAAAIGQTPAQISKAFLLAIEGNARGLKQLGIAISSADVANRAAALGFAGTASELNDAQKAAVFYSLVLEKTAKFQGQAALTAGDFAGRLRTAKAAIGDAAIALGSSLAPAAEGILALFTAIVSPIGKLPPALLAFAAAATVASVALNLLSGSAFVGAISAFVSGIFDAIAALGIMATEIATVGATSLALEAIVPPLALIALTAGAVAAAFVVFKGNTESTAERLKKIGDAAGDAAKQFKILTAVDIKQFTTDLKALGDVGAVELGDKILVGDISQLQGLDLKGIIARAKEVKTAFADLLNQKSTGNAGIGAAKDALDALNAAGLGNTETVKAMQVAYDKEVTARIAANEEAKKGADILNADSILREKNEATIKAQTAAINDLFTVTDQLHKAQRDASAALDDQSKAQAKVNILLKEGGRAEIAEARIKIGDANDSLTASILRQAEAQKALDKLNAPATARELSDATDALTLAQIAEAQATRARDDALKALNKTQTKAIDLTHLSLDQLRTTLANARATLAAQRSGPATSTGGATPEETAITAEINLRAAKEKTADAAKDLLDLQQKGLVKTDEILHQEREVVLAKNAVTKAQEEVNKRQGELDGILAGNSQFAKDLATAQDLVKTATDKVHDTQAQVSDLVSKQKDDTNTILGTQKLISDEMLRQIGLHKDLFAQDANLRRGLVENTLSTIGATINRGGGVIGPLVGGDLGQPTIDALFNALSGNNLQGFIDLLKKIGVNLPGRALGGLITRPEFAFLGEKFKVESVVPWGQGAARVWDVLSQSLPHMPTTVRQRLEPVIPGAQHQISAATHLNRPVTEIDYKTLGREVARALKEAGVGGGEINVHPTPGMDETRLARKVAREIDRYRGMP